MVQLRSGADVVQEHVVDIWSEIFLRDGIILQQTTATWSLTCAYTHILCIQVMLQQVAWWVLNGTSRADTPFMLRDVSIADPNLCSPSGSHYTRIRFK